MKILSIGNFSGSSNTSLHRHLVLKNIATEFDEINSFDQGITFKYRVLNKLFSLGLSIYLPDISNVNKRIILLVLNNLSNPYDIIWIDKGLTVNPETLLFIKNNMPSSKIISYTADNMVLRHNQSQNFVDCIPLYNFHITTKSYIINDFKKLGAKRVIFTRKSYSSNFHFPRNLTVNDQIRFGSDVGFIGVWEKERCDSVIFLANNGIQVKVFGDGKWNNYKHVNNLTILPAIFSSDYSKALQAFKISLCFLRKINFDQQTARTMEIPACGGFMLAERTDEHLELFKEGFEAEFFANNEELLEKCKYYLLHEDERIKIAKSGTERCKNSGYSNEKTIKRLVNLIVNDGY